MSLVRAERDAIEAVLTEIKKYESVFGKEEHDIWNEAPAPGWTYKLVKTGQRIYLLGISSPRNKGGMRDRVAVFGFDPSDGNVNPYEPSDRYFQTVKRAILVRPATTEEQAEYSARVVAVNLAVVSYGHQETILEIHPIGAAAFSHACA